MVDSAFVIIELAHWDAYDGLDKRCQCSKRLHLKAYKLLLECCSLQNYCSVWKTHCTWWFSFIFFFCVHNFVSRKSTTTATRFSCYVIWTRMNKYVEKYWYFGTDAVLDIFLLYFKIKRKEGREKKKRVRLKSWLHGLNEWWLRFMVDLFNERN